MIKSFAEVIFQVFIDLRPEWSRLCYLLGNEKAIWMRIYTPAQSAGALEYTDCITAEG